MLGLAKIWQKSIRATIFSTILSTGGRSGLKGFNGGYLKGLNGINGLKALKAAAKGVKGFVISDKILIIFLRLRKR